ncbi:hypothetical protein AALB47_22975 [Lachnospiraceae bacterium 54-11]
MDYNRKLTGKLIIFLFIFSTGLFLAKAFISSEISLEDEMHYIATALRFYNGDAYLVDDWSPEQLNSFLLLPFVYLFEQIFHSSDGIVIYFRILHLFFKLIIVVYSLYRLKVTNKFTACSFIGILFYYFFTPYNIEALSYNTIPLSMMFLIGIIMITSNNHKGDYYLCGVLLAFSVLSQPFIAILYFSGIISYCGYIVYVRFTHKNKNFHLILSGKNFIIFTIGICTVAAAFLFFVFSRANLYEILSNVIYIFNEPDHNVSTNISNTLLNKLTMVLNTFFSFCQGRITFINILCLCAIILSKRKKNIIIPFLLSIISLLISCMNIILSENAFIMNAIYIPFVWFSFEALIMVNKNKLLHTVIWTACCIYTISTSLGTNTGILSTSASMCSFAIFSMLTVSDLEISSFRPKYMTPVFQIAVLGIFIGILLLTFIMRLCIVWTDTYDKKTYSCYLSKGPLKGTVTSENVYKQYNAILETLDAIECQDSDILFCGTSTPTAYLYLNIEFGTMGTPFFYLDYNRLESYFTLHPDKLPTIIYYECLSGTSDENNFLYSIRNTYHVIKDDTQFLAVRY